MKRSILFLTLLVSAAAFAQTQTVRICTPYFDNLSVRPI